VKAIFPADWDLHVLLRMGNDAVGERLANYSVWIVNPAKVVDLFVAGREQELLIEAGKRVAAKTLYEEWRQIANP